MNPKNKLILIIFLFAVLLLGSFLRLYKLGEKSLWTDELATMQNTVNIVDFKSFLAHTPGDDIPKFYSLLLKYWMRIGSSEYFMRLLSVIFGILVIAVIYCLSRLFFNRRVSLTSAFLTAVSPFLLLYDREIRVYSLFSLLSLLSIYFFVRSLRENKKPFWVIYTLINILNIYTHYYALLILGVQWLYIIICRKNYRSVIKPWFITNAIIFSSFLVRLASFISDVAYFAPWAIPRERFPFIFGKEFVEFFYIFFSFSVGQTILPWNLYAVPVLFVVVICFFIAMKKFFSLPQENLFLLLLLFVPIIIGVIFRISLPRYFTFVAPIFFIFVSRGLWMLPKKITIIAILIIALGWGLGVANYYNNKEFHFMGSIDPWKEVGAFLKENVKSDEVLYCFGLGTVPLKYYYKHPMTVFEMNKLLRDTDEKKVKRVWLVFTYQEEYENWLKARELFGKNYTLILEKKWAQDPDFKLKKKFFRKNFLPYRVIAELYERK